VSWLWPAFKIGKLALAGFQKLSAQLQGICYPKGAKDLNLPVLKSFRNSKSFHAKQLSIEYKIKGII
jgi:hypothetical protein